MARWDKFLEGVTAGLEPGVKTGQAYVSGREKRNIREAGEAASKMLSVEQPTALPVGDDGREQEGPIQPVEIDYTKAADAAAQGYIKNGDFAGATKARQGVMDIAHGKSQQKLEEAQRYMDSGDLRAAAAAIQEAHRHVPNGMNADVEPGKDGKLRWVSYDENSGEKLGETEITKEMLNDFNTRIKDPKFFSQLQQNRKILALNEKKFSEAQRQFDQSMLKWAADSNNANQKAAMNTWASVLKAQKVGLNNLTPAEIAKVGSDTQTYVRNRYSDAADGKLDENIRLIYGPDEDGKTKIPDPAGLVNTLASQIGIATNHIIPATNVKAAESALVQVMNDESDSGKMIKGWLNSGGSANAFVEDGKMFVRFNDPASGKGKSIQVPLPPALIRNSPEGLAAMEQYRQQIFGNIQEVGFNARDPQNVGVIPEDYGVWTKDGTAGGPVTAQGVQGSGGPTVGIGGPQEQFTPPPADTPAADTPADTPADKPGVIPQQTKPFQQQTYDYSPGSTWVGNVVDQIKQRFGDFATRAGIQSEFMNIYGRSPTDMEMQQIFDEVRRQGLSGTGIRDAIPNPN